MSLWPTHSSKANSCCIKNCSKKNCGHLSLHASAIQQPRLCFQHFRNNLQNHYAVTTWKSSFSGVANIMKRKVQSAVKFRVTPEDCKVQSSTHPREKLRSWLFSPEGRMQKHFHTVRKQIHNNRRWFCSTWNNVWYGYLVDNCKNKIMSWENIPTLPQEGLSKILSWILSRVLLTEHVIFSLHHKQVDVFLPREGTVALPQLQWYLSPSIASFCVNLSHISWDLFVSYKNGNKFMRNTWLTHK